METDSGIAPVLSHSLKAADMASITSVMVMAISPCSFVVTVVLRFRVFSALTLTIISR